MGAWAGAEPAVMKGIFVTYRLVTRSDFDGLVCAVLLRHLDMIDEITFVHPKDVQDGAIQVNARDILTNLPYAPGAHLVFDHHHSEALRTGGTAPNHIIDRSSPADIGSVMLRYGGGGHVAAGTCQVPHTEAERVIAEVVAAVGVPREVRV
jgi:nanoRNase/pAp phosphatase (c-di-AMP/oligoRNAs hydrolase)